LASSIEIIYQPPGLEDTAAIELLPEYKDKGLYRLRPKPQLAALNFGLMA